MRGHLILGMTLCCCSEEEMAALEQVEQRWPLAWDWPREDHAMRQTNTCEFDDGAVFATGLLSILTFETSRFYGF